ncbi:MAG: aminotransferase class IV [Crocinitomicaceae bacterium]|nr:aminotransferase class IV [Crocinitomicaceae bacterium]
MAIETYVNCNGVIKIISDMTLEPGNRGHLYGDGLFETIRVFNGRPLNLQYHIDRLIEGAKCLKMNVSSSWDSLFFGNEIQKVLDKNKINQGGRVRISLDRVTGGTYKPISNDVVFLIEGYPLKTNKFHLNENGFVIDQYTEIRKNVDKLSNFKTKNALLYVLAAIYAQENGLDEVLLTTPRGNILEASSSNLFVVSNRTLYTPSLEDGCLAGVMRMTIINLALSKGIKVYECSILPQNLLAADEIFLTNAIAGVQWVEKYRSKVYTNSFANSLAEWLNHHFETV